MSVNNETKEKKINVLKIYSMRFNGYIAPEYSDAVFTQLNESLAENIVNDVLKPFKEFAQNIGVFELCTYSEKSQKKDYTPINFWHWKFKKYLVRSKASDERGNKRHEDNEYLLKYNERYYIMCIYDNADILGFCNVQGNEQTYLMCNIKKIGLTQRILYDVVFSFDIVTMKFIELFEIEKFFLDESNEDKRIMRIKQASDETIDLLNSKFAGMKLMEI